MEVWERKELEDLKAMREASRLYRPLIATCKWFTRKEGACPLPSLPGEDYCPKHLVMSKRIIERKEKSMVERLRKALGGE